MTIDVYIYKMLYRTKMRRFVETIAQSQNCVSAALVVMRIDEIVRNYTIEQSFTIAY